MKKLVLVLAVLAVPGWAGAAKSASNYSIKQAWPTKYGTKKQPQNETQSRQAPANDKAKQGGKPADAAAPKKQAPARQGLEANGTDAQGAAR